MEINLLTLATILRELTANELKLYMYFCSFRNGEGVILNPIEIEYCIGMKNTVFHKAYGGLVKKGYIVENGNNITFYQSLNLKDEKEEKYEVDEFDWSKFGI